MNKQCQLLFKTSVYEPVNITFLQEFYPINYLRNIALNYTEAKYVFLSDVDFAPSFGLHQYVMNMIKQGYLDGKKVSKSSVIFNGMHDIPDLTQET